MKVFEIFVHEQKLLKYLINENLNSNTYNMRLDNLHSYGEEQVNFTEWNFDNILDLGKKKIIISFSGQFFQKLMRQGGFIFYCFRSE